MDTSIQNTPTRRLGYWLKAVDRLMAAEFAQAFRSEGVTRRDWRILNTIGTKPVPAHKLDRLVERGWITRTDDGWTLTDAGTEAKERLGGIVAGIRAKVTDAVEPEAYDTTIATLEQIARAYGWEEGMSLPRGRKHGRHGHRGHRGHRGHGRFGRFGREGFGPHAHRFDEHGCRDGRRFDGERDFGGRGFRGEHGFDSERGFRGERDAAGFGRPEHGFGRHGHADRDLIRHARHRMARFAQRAYEHGFDAGFSRGRDS